MSFFTDKTKLFASALFISLFILVGLFAGPQQAQAVWDGNLYQPGTTLDPECTPTQTSCNTVSPLSQSGDQSLSGTLTVIPTTAAGLSLNPYGTNPGNTSELRLHELTANGNNFVAFKSTDSLTGDVVWTLPNADGTTGQTLATDGSGTLSWATNSGVSSLTTPTGSNANGGSIASNVLTLSFADAINPGIVSTGAQTIAGAKTFSGLSSFTGAGTGLAVTNNATVGGTLGVTGATTLSSTLGVTGNQTNTGNLNVNGNTTLGDAGADTLTLNSNTISTPNNLNIDSDTLYLDATNNRVGIGTITPGAKLAVATGATGNIFSAASVTTLPLTGWSTRQIVTVSNANASSLSNYQVRMTVNTAALVTAGLLQADGDDLRFTSSNGITLLDHFVESGINTASTVIWVKVPTLAVGNTSLFMYYGNAVATSVSSPTNVFDLYDDFDGSMAQWTTLNMDNGSSPGIAIGVHVNGSQTHRIVSTATFTSGVIVEFYEPTIACVEDFINLNQQAMAADFGFRSGTGTSGLAGGLYQLCDTVGGGGGVLANGPDTTYNNTVRTNLGTNSAASGQTISVALKSSTLADITIGGSTTSNISFNSSGTFNISAGSRFNGSIANEVGLVQVGRVVVRQYAAAVPTVTLGTDPSLGVQDRFTVNNNGNVLFGQYNDGLIGFDMPGITYDRRMRITAGASDTADNSQGASVDLHGNDHANAGTLDLVAGGTTGDITAWTNNIQRMIIDQSGNVGIGTSTPAAKLHITPSAAAALQIDAYGAAAGNTGELRFGELAANGSNYVGFKSSDALASNVVYTLPNADGTSGQVLSTNGTGGLSWSAASGVAASYMRGTLSGSVGSNTDVTLAQNASYGSDITLSSNVITLKAGKTYRMSAAIYADFGANTDSMPFAWVDTTNTQLTGSTQALVRPLTFTTTNGSISVAEAVFTPTVDTGVKLRSQTGQTATVNGSYASFFIEVIAGNAAVTGQMVDYVNVIAAANMTPANNAAFVFDTITAGNIPYSISTGLFTLTAGKTYRLQTAMQLNNALTIQWQTAAGVGLNASTISNGVANTIDAYEVIYTPSVNTDVKLVSLGGGVTAIGGRSSATITQLGSSAITGDSMVAVGGNTLTGTGGTLTVGTLNSNALAFTANNVTKMTLSTSTGANYMRLNGYGAGTLVTDSSGNVTVSSDAVLKENETVFTRGLESVLGLAPATYNWTSGSGLDTKQTYTGFIAQNVKDFIPEAIGTAQDGTLTLSDRPILAALVNATKELNSKSEVHSLQIDKISDLIGLSTNDLNAVKLEYLTGVTAENNERFATLKAEWDTLREEYQGQKQALEDQQFITSHLDQVATTQILPTVTPATLEKLVISGALTVGNLEVLGESIFRNIATFTADANFEKAVVFAGDVTFKGRALFEDQDMAGFAKVALGQDKVVVTYEKEYPQAPVVQISLASVELSDAAYEVNTLINVCSKDESREACEDKATKDALSFNRGYAVVSSTTKGFAILLENPALYDLTFNWIAIPVKNARTQINEVTTTPSPSPSSSPTPSPEVTITPSPTPVTAEKEVPTDEPVDEVVEEPATLE